MEALAGHREQGGGAGRPGPMRSMGGGLDFAVTFLTLGLSTKESVTIREVILTSHVLSFGG